MKSRREPLSMLVLIINEDLEKAGVSILKTVADRDIIVFSGRGTARLSLMQLVGLRNRDRLIAISFIEQEKIVEVIEELRVKLELDKPRTGIAFSINTNGHAGLIKFNKERFERVKNLSKMEGAHMKSEYELIMIITNRGFADDIMEIAHTAGASGGTVVHGRGIASDTIETFLGVKIEPEKEVVLTVVAKKDATKVLTAIHAKTCTKELLNTFAFSMPVSDLVGGTHMRELLEEKNE